MNRKSTTHEEKFIHIQDFTEAAKTAGASDYMHNTRYKGATVFARKEMGVWHATVALCSKSDPFNRRIGRQVARRRYFEKPVESINIGSDPRYVVLCSLALMAASAS